MEGHMEVMVYEGLAVLSTFWGMQALPFCLSNALDFQSER